MSIEARYGHMVEALRAQHDLQAALSLLSWDQETCMPAGVIEARSRQIGQLAAVVHARETDPAFLEIVDRLASDLPQLPPSHAVDVRETKWRLDRKRRLTPELVRARSTLHAEARNVWIVARQQDRFVLLAPYLARIVALEHEVAAAIDGSRNAYDVLLENYEPGLTAAGVEDMFGRLRQALVPLVDAIRERRPAADDALCGAFPLEQQRRFNGEIAARMGFDFQRGRLDEAAHPFTTSIGNDVRITTRYREGDLRYALFSTIHETGHALYEQGLDPSAWGTPRGESCSLGVHESQSRLWENQIGRSEAFWRHLLPLARAFFPQLASRSLADVVRAVNEVRPSLIRTEADEITYNLHIILRFELERALLAGDLAVADLPLAWREKMAAYLGVVPESDRDGVLQDVHWSCGDIGYFPTYTFGNIYAAQLLEAAGRALGAIDEIIAAGEFATLLFWLRTTVHRLGQTYRAPELIRHATGSAPTVEPLIRHLQKKLSQ